MATLFNTLNIGYTGLNASQVAISTTSHNISNAETEGYSRQRVVLAAHNPVQMRDGHVGNGVDIQTIKRVFDILYLIDILIYPAIKSMQIFQNQL
jgi:flagellar hook-associated protein 1 FlgK